MPVTFNPAPVTANVINRNIQQTSSTLFRSSCPALWDKCDEVLQSSFGRGPDATLKALPVRGGIVTTISDAYNQHHAVSIRPDDVWLSILTQFSFYVNAHAEELRYVFVAHEGKEELVVHDVGTRYTVDFGRLANELVSLMRNFIVDPDLQAWILPSFSTTTITDTTTASVLMMATMKEYFSYTMSLTCGIPRVTLEGEKSDWEEVLRRADKLKEYGTEPSAWHDMLVPVLARFVRAFDEPNAERNLDFWQKVAHYQGGGSGPTWLSGWLTAFCAWDAKGKWLGLPLDQTEGKLGSIEDIQDDLRKNPFSRPNTALSLDGAHYHVLDSDDIPLGYAEVDVKLDDNGVVFETIMVAGVVASGISDSGDTSLTDDGVGDVLSPVPGWWMFTKRTVSRQEERLKQIREEMGL